MIISFYLPTLPERKDRREKTSWKAQKEMVRCSGQGC